MQAPAVEAPVDEEIEEVEEPETVEEEELPTE